jgi:hypothetical protein
MNDESGDQKNGSGAIRSNLEIGSNEMDEIESQYSLEFTHVMTVNDSHLI